MTDRTKTSSLPERVILSRKGFDSGAGGCASPILPCGTPYSLPIPDYRSAHRYADLRHNHTEIGKVVTDLSRGRVRPQNWTHLDPDLSAAATSRPRGFQAALGQTGAAATHLAGEKVSKGDLFLFFGWFRETEITGDGTYAYRRGAPDIHAMFGWLRIGEILSVAGNEEAITERFPALTDHPHIARKMRADDQRNTIYVAAEKLDIPGIDLPGAGTFKSLSPARRLTAPGKNRSSWKLPDWIHPDKGTRLSYHDDHARWEGGLLQAAARGQEFVLSNMPAKPLSKWLDAIFTDLA